MNIGEPQKVHEIVPLIQPIPLRPEPATPEPTPAVPAKTPEKEPAHVD